MRHVQLRCRYRLASLGGLRLVVPIDGDGVDERLIVGLMLTDRDGSRLAVRFRDELRSAYVGHPDLNRPETLRAQALAMFAYPIACARHGVMLHVTRLAGNRPASCWRIL